MRTYFTLPAELPKLGLNIYEIGVYVMLSSHIDRSTRQAFPSVPTLARECGISQNSVRKALRSLCEKGLISQRENYNEKASGARARTANIYTVTSLVPHSPVGAKESFSTFDLDDFVAAAIRASRRDDD